MQNIGIRVQTTVYFCQCTDRIIVLLRQNSAITCISGYYYLHASGVDAFPDIDIDMLFRGVNVRGRVCGAVTPPTAKNGDLVEINK